MTCEWNNGREGRSTRRVLAEHGLDGNGIRVYDIDETFDPDDDQLFGCHISIFEDGSTKCCEQLRVALLDSIGHSCSSKDVFLALPAGVSRKNFDPKKVCGVHLEVILSTVEFEVPEEFREEPTGDSEE